MTQRLADMLENLQLLIERVGKSTSGRSYDELISNSEAYDALTYRLAMIGETCRKLPDEVKEKYPELPWREMATFRNFASHDYFGVDANLVWKAANELEPIRTMVDKELQNLK